jgi:hypothetical protein
VSTGGELLDRPDDKPSPDEDAAIARAEKMTWRERRELKQIEFSLSNSRKRITTYLDELSYDNYRMERRVQDRLLDRLLTLRPTIREMPLEEAITRAEACS